ncbi:hypothetical protein Tco_1340350, partial [Tanacetum coccineum]
VSALREAQEKYIIPTTFKAAKTLSKVASLKEKSTDKGKRFQRRSRSTKEGKDINTRLDAEAEVNTGEVEINTGNIGINNGSEDFSTGSLGVSTGTRPVSTPSVVQTTKVTISSPIKSQR